MFHVYRSLIFILCSLLCLPSCIRDDSPSGAEGVRPGDRLPDFTVSLNDNTLVVASDLLGKVAVLVFFSYGMSRLPERISCRTTAL